MATLLFDLDETLIYELASVEAALEATCALAQAKHGLDPGALTCSVRRRARELWYATPVFPWCKQLGTSSFGALTADFHGPGAELAWLREWAPTYRRTAWSRALADHGVTDDQLVTALIDRYYVERNRRHLPFPETPAVLQALSSRHQLALLSNGFSTQQREKLTGAGLADFFPLVVIAGDLGYGKPDPRLFRHALTQSECEAADAWMIGDRLQGDIAGAQAVGMKTVWVNRNCQEAEAGIVPDAEVTDLTGLENIVH